MRSILGLGLAALLSMSGAWAGEARNYTIDLRYEPASGQVTAKAAIGLKPETQAKSLTFYLHDELRVSTVRVDGRPVRFRQKTVAYDYSYDLKANEVEVESAAPNGRLEVVYAGRFSPSKARSPSDYMRGDRDGLYLRSYGYSLWFPVFAPSNASFPPVDFDAVRITAPADFRSVFVGGWVGRTEKNGLATETWRAKAVGPYAAQLTVRRFAVRSSGAVTAYFLTDGASDAAAARILGVAGKLLAYYKSHYREKVAQQALYMVEEPEYGDISGGNMIGLQESNWRAIKSDGVELVTLAHELVHAFVQTQTAADDPLYVFQLEGFPSYFHLPALESILGTAWYDSELDRIEKAYLKRRTTGRDGGEALPPEKPILTMTANEVGTYKDVFVLNDRALLFWDWLRRTLPRERFDALVREMTAAPQMDKAGFFALMRNHAPALEADAHVWLESTDFPERFRRPG